MTARAASAPFRTLAAAVVAVTWILILIGGYVKATGSGLACPDWPQCWGRYLPRADMTWTDNAPYANWQIWLEYAHRAVASVLGLMVIGMAVLAWRKERDRSLAFFSTLAVFLVVVQGLLGGLTVIFGNPPPVTAAHLGLAVVFFGVVLYVAFLAFAPRPGDPHAERAPAPARGAEGAAPTAAGEGALARLKAASADYWTLSKPGILLLLVIAGGCAAFVARPQDFPWTTAALAILGGALSSASASALNNYLERDLDAQMMRTALRPLPMQRLPPRNALIFAAITSVASFLLLAVWVNLLTAFLALGGLVFYVLIYTLWLKRLTPQNIVIGGGAGSFAALVGWAGVTNEVSLSALLMGALIFLWTPPHFWALALVHREDYARAGFPMLPVVAGEAATKRQILVYAVLTAVASLLFVWPLGTLGAIYAGSAVALGAVFVAMSWKLHQAKDVHRPGYRLFWYSIVYLGVLFFAMVVDRAILA